MTNGNGPHQVALVVAPEFSFLGLGLAVEPLFVANWLAQAELFRWSLLSVDGLSVRASNGIGLPMNGALGERDGWDTVLVVTSFDARLPARDQRNSSACASQLATNSGSTASPSPKKENSGATTSAT